MKSEYIEYRDGDTVLEGYLVYDESQTGPRPAVIVAHDWSGRREYACNAAESMARLGYVGFALDMYGKGVFGKPSDTEGNSRLMGPFVEDRALLRGRVQAALDTVRDLPQTDSRRIAAIGFCFGGMTVLELARSGADVQGVVSIHGLFARGEISNEEIRARVLCLHGHEDPMAPPEQVRGLEKEMTEAGVDWQIHLYGHTKHAFTNPDANNPDFGTVYSERADRRARRSVENFLEEIFT